MAVVKPSALTLFVQLVKHVPERIITDAVAKRQTDYRSKGVRHADALVSLLFHQLSGSTSLRDTVLGMESCRDNGYEQHSGFQIVKRSTPAYVNEHRNYEVYEDVYYALYIVQWYDEDSQRWFEFLTNDRELEPEEIAQLYRDRWQIELFFKKVKQNLKIKDFLGTSYNAVMSQVWCAAIAILLLEVLRLQSEYPWSFSNLVHNLRLNLLSFRLIEDWLNAPDQAVTLVNVPAQQELFSTG